MQSPIIRPSIILTPSTPTPVGRMQTAVLYTASSEKPLPRYNEKPRQFSDEDLLGPPLEDLIASQRERQAQLDYAMTRRKVNLLTAFFALLISTLVFTTYFHPGFAASISRLPPNDFDVSSTSDGNGIYFLAEDGSTPRSPSMMQDLVDRVSSPFVSSHISKRSTPEETHYAAPLPLLRFAHSSATSSRHESTTRNFGKRSLEEESTEAMLAERAQINHARQLEERMDLQRRVKVQETKLVQEALLKEARGRLLRRREMRLAERAGGDV